NGYPLRLLLPGWEGNMNIKWVRRIQLTETPGMTFYEARTYAPILPGGKAYRFYFLQEVKSFITHPSPGLAMNGQGFYEISGIAYSGNGRIAKVMVSADGGKTWAQAALQEPIHSKAFTRFRVPWRWDGGAAVLQSPRVGRCRIRATHTSAACSRAGPDHSDSRGHRISKPTLQRDHNLGGRCQARGETCT